MARQIYDAARRISVRSYRHLVPSTYIYVYEGGRADIEATRVTGNIELESNFHDRRRHSNRVLGSSA